jgi:hypothetical protein
MTSKNVLEKINQKCTIHKPWQDNMVNTGINRGKSTCNIAKDIEKKPFGIRLIDTLEET